jgi:hypothetical protein
MREPATGFEVESSGGVFALGALTISVVGILAIGVYPSPLFQAAGNAARILLQQ